MFDDIKDMLYCEIDEIAKQGKLDMTTVKALGEIMDILKDMGTVEMFEEGINIPEDEYSFANSYRSGGYSQKRMPMYYNDGNSYRSGRSMNTGYSRRGNVRRGYSYDDSKAHMVEKLNHLMMEANDQKDKEAIQRLIEQMENN